MMRRHTFYTTDIENFSFTTKADLSDSTDEIKKDIVHFIISYRKGKITLKKLIRLLEKIKAEHKYELTHDLKNIINEVSSLSIIDNILLDILTELKTSKNI